MGCSAETGTLLYKGCQHYETVEKTEKDTTRGCQVERMTTGQVRYLGKCAISPSECSIPNACFLSGNIKADNGMLGERNIKQRRRKKGRKKHHGRLLMKMEKGNRNDQISLAKRRGSSMTGRQSKSMQKGSASNHICRGLARGSERILSRVEHVA